MTELSHNAHLALVAVGAVAAFAVLAVLSDPYSNFADYWSNDGEGWLAIPFGLGAFLIFGVVMYSEVTAGHVDTSGSTEMGR